MIEWNDYWAQKYELHNQLYDRIAVQYRKYIIKPYLKKYLHTYFNDGTILLHAGCGGGQVEDDITNKFVIIGMDTSSEALKLYKLNHDTQNLIHGDIALTGIKNESLDGIYNLGVMEHSTQEEIHTILVEFNRILKPDGTVILFVPPEYGSTVIFFKIIHYILNSVLKKDIYFQPPEINRIQSREWTNNIIKNTEFVITDFNFEPDDLYTHVAIVLKKSITFKNGIV
jgi:SAM-dependent methyltransferase